MGKAKHQNPIRRFLSWLLGNTAWDFLRYCIALLVTNRILPRLWDRVSIMTLPELVNNALVFCGVLFLVLIILSIVQSFIEWILSRRKKRGAADSNITTVLTELNENGIELACIQVIANENVCCMAKIESIVELNKSGSRQKRGMENLVNKLNPRGVFLLWLSNLRDYSDLEKDVPDCVTTVTAHGNIARLGFQWEGSDNHRLDGTRYEIGVRIFRKEDGLIDMGLVKGILRIKSEKGIYGDVTKKLHWEQESGN